MRSASQTGDSIYASENSSYTSSAADIDEGMGSGVSYAATENIKYEKEVPLAMQVFTKKEISSFTIGGGSGGMNRGKPDSTDLRHAEEFALSLVKKGETWGRNSIKF